MDIVIRKSARTEWRLLNKIGGTTKIVWHCISWCTQLSC
jgi:hypothetical protein